MYRCRVASLRIVTETFRRALFTPTPWLAAALDGAVALIGDAGVNVGRDCICLQLRLEDFVTMCAAGYDWVERKMASGLTCIPKAEIVRGNATAWPGTCVTLLTNDPVEAAVLVGDSAQGRTLLDSAALSALAGRAAEAVMRAGGISSALFGPPGRALLSMLVEQYVCARSALAVLNGISNFGEALAIERTALNLSFRLW